MADVNAVKMDDGRIVDFTSKQKLRKDVNIADDGVITVRLDFVNGETRLFTAPPSLLQKAAAHGFSQKLGDEISGLADVGDAVMAIDDLMDRLNAGEWTAKRESNGMAGASVLAKALCEHTGKTMDVIRAFLSVKTNAEKLALRGNAAIAPIVARLEAEKPAKAKTQIDTDALLKQL